MFSVASKAVGTLRKIPMVSVRIQARKHDIQEASIQHRIGDEHKFLMHNEAKRERLRTCELMTAVLVSREEL